MPLDLWLCIPKCSSVMKLHPTAIFPYWKRQRAANWRMPDSNDILKAFEIFRWKALYKNKVLLLPRQRKMHAFSVIIQEPNIVVLLVSFDISFAFSLMTI
jgi:hypothetical protein